MGAIMTSLLKNLIEVGVFVLIACAGIMCGKNVISNKSAAGKNQDTK